MFLLAAILDDCFGGKRIGGGGGGGGGRGRGGGGGGEVAK